MDEPKPNITLLRAVLKQIDEHPETWDQEHYIRKTDCGTACCIAGHAIVLSGHDQIAWCVDMTTGSRCGYVLGDESMPMIARIALGITERESCLLFHAKNTREDVQRWSEAIAKRAGEEL